MGQEGGRALGSTHRASTAGSNKETGRTGGAENTSNFVRHCGYGRKELPRLKSQAQLTEL